MSHIDTLFQEAQSERLLRYRHEWELWLALRALWPPEPQELHPDLAAGSEVVDSSEFSLSISEPDPLLWSIAFTPNFRKAIAAFDRKLQGRVLTALTELSAAPTTVQGDTQKPLSGPLRGLWRYRFGDYRLVYQPQEEKQLVVLVDFAARGSIYEA